MALKPELGTVLVTGGCGFVGYHLVGLLLQESLSDDIYVISRNPTKNLHDNVKYYPCDLTDQAATRALVVKLRPRVVFHVASPVGNARGIPLKEYLDGNVAGTQSFLEACQEADVEAFVYTSTNSVVAKYPHINVNESAPYHSRMDSWCTGYHWSKALAEKAVIAANQVGGPMKTVAIRISSVYGVRDSQMLKGIIARVLTGNTKAQIGDGSNLLDICWVGNAAKAHALAACALLNPTRAHGAVAGEIFNATDGNPVPFWEMVRMYYRAAGVKIDDKDVKVVPAWFAVPLAQVLEWIYWIGTFGQYTPELTYLGAVYATETFTYDISKAKRVLGYEPKVDRQHEIQKAVQFEMKAQGQPLPKTN